MRIVPGDLVKIDLAFNTLETWNVSVASLPPKVGWMCPLAGRPTANGHIDRVLFGTVLARISCALLPLSLTHTYVDYVFIPTKPDEVFLVMTRLCRGGSDRFAIVNAGWKSGLIEAIK